MAKTKFEKTLINCIWHACRNEKQNVVCLTWKEAVNAAGRVRHWAHETVCLTVCLSLPSFSTLLHLYYTHLSGFTLQICEELVLDIARKTRQHANRVKPLNFAGQMLWSEQMAFWWWDKVISFTVWYDFLNSIKSLMVFHDN